ncbi:MAG: nucleotide sugar dehydrogenase [Acidimicrobiia bacterium]|nr:nucleotide sugar dehydrogenase [Acidimicrobiia bacterium]
MTAPGSVVVVGGCGRVGLPLGLALADSGRDVTLYDINRAAIEQVGSGEMPFLERGADEVLERVLAAGRLHLSAEPESVVDAEHVIIVVGTPVDEHLNPNPGHVLRAMELMIDHLRDGQHLVLRSTVYPGTTAMIERLLERHGLRIDVSFCPERIAEGKAMEELFSLPQIVSGRTDAAKERAADLFGSLTKSIVELEVEEAELAKLFTNTWRYIKFAAANQLYMIANDFGADFERIRAALAQDYPRAMDMPGAGLAAGPCLLKDTMQLAAFNNNNFTLGHASMMINEGLPLYLVARLEQSHDLAGKTVGILGMAFKAESDDTRDSLSYKLKRLLRLRADEVLCTDPYVTSDKELVPLDEVLGRADLLVIGAPHREYSTIDTDVPIVDMWNLMGAGVRT